MMPKVVWILSFVLAASGLARPVVAADSRQTDTSEIVTLYALDSVTSHVSLNDGKPGTVVEDHLTYNRDSQLSFDTYSSGSFTVGIQGREKGAILDLGDDSALKARYGYSETVGNVQGFASIHLEGGRAVIVKDYRTRQFQPLKEFEELGTERENANTATVVLGHMYLVRVSKANAPPIYTKLKVLAYVPSQYVTIRWSRI